MHRLLLGFSVLLILALTGCGQHEVTQQDKNVITKQVKAFVEVRKNFVTESIRVFESYFGKPVPEVVRKHVNQDVDRIFGQGSKLVAGIDSILSEAKDDTLPASRYEKMMKDLKALKLINSLSEKRARKVIEGYEAWIENYDKALKLAAEKAQATLPEAESLYAQIRKLHDETLEKYPFRKRRIDALNDEAESLMDSLNRLVSGADDATIRRAFLGDRPFASGKPDVNHIVRNLVDRLKKIRELYESLEQEYFERVTDVEAECEVAVGGAFWDDWDDWDNTRTFHFRSRPVSESEYQRLVSALETKKTWLGERNPVIHKRHLSNPDHPLTQALKPFLPDIQDVMRRVHGGRDTWEFWLDDDWCEYYASGVRIIDGQKVPFEEELIDKSRADFLRKRLANGGVVLSLFKPKGYFSDEMMRDVEDPMPYLVGNGAYTRPVESNNGGSGTDWILYYLLLSDLFDKKERVIPGGRYGSTPARPSGTVLNSERVWKSRRQSAEERIKKTGGLSGRGVFGIRNGGLRNNAGAMRSRGPGGRGK